MNLRHQAFSIKYEGRRAIAIHVKCTKHKEAVKNQKQTSQITSFSTKTDTPQENVVTAAEIGEVYHGVIHHLIKIVVIASKVSWTYKHN